MNDTIASSISRRGLLAAAGAAGGGLLAAHCPAGPAQRPARPRARFRYCLNTATIRGQNLPVQQEIDVAAEAGYGAIEPWVRKLHRFAEAGGSLKDLRQRIEDRGLTVESAIGFARWIVEDDQARAAGFEQARRDMELLAQLGGLRIAASPAGVPKGQTVPLMKAAQRYRKLLQLGDQIGVTPQVEMWGGNPTIGRLSVAVSVAIESGHPKACILGDLFHLYRSGDGVNGLKLLGPQALQVFHLNDYPADPPRQTIRDEHRVYPGDGVAPIQQLLRTFQLVGAAPVLSLELFNRDYWKQDPLQVARTGLQKMRDAVAAAAG